MSDNNAPAVNLRLELPEGSEAAAGLASLADSTGLSMTAALRIVLSAHYRQAIDGQLSRHLAEALIALDSGNTATVRASIAAAIETMRR